MELQPSDPPEIFRRIPRSALHFSILPITLALLGCACGAPAWGSEGTTASPAGWFDMGKLNLLVVMILLSAAILTCTFLAGRGRAYPIRQIAGIRAVEEAVGRATEMGKPVLFVPGNQDMDNVQTVAGLTILASIAAKTAEYDAKLVVPTSRSIVMATGRETVKQAYQAAGRADAYSEDMVYYVTDEQFGYVAALDGYMVREKPAACFYLGAFFAESLILAETGNSIGAIQVAGTAMPTQLPFFVAACDYTLIGEELFAASAYLSQDRRLIGSLRGQDLGKAAAMVAIGAGSLLLTLAAATGNPGLEKLARSFTRLFTLNF